MDTNPSVEAPSAEDIQAYLDELAKGRAFAHEPCYGTYTFVINEMFNFGLISQEQHQEALDTPRFVSGMSALEWELALEEHHSGRPE